MNLPRDLRPEPFAAALINSLDRRYPDAQAHSLAIELAAEMRDNTRHGVLNPAGVLTNRCQKLQRKADESRRASDPARISAERDRYDELWIWALSEASRRSLGPAELARMLVGARELGFSRLRGSLISRLERMGARWPVDPITRPSLVDDAGKA